MASLTTEHLGGSFVPGGSRAFYNRMAENAFRRLPLFLLPIVLVTVMGALVATRETPDFRATGTLQATRNPLVGQRILDSEIETWETPAEGRARLINEQLLTDAFITDVATAAGLGEELAQGLITTTIIKANVYASADGTSLLSVNATWTDPETAYQLASSTIAAYIASVATSVASQSEEAVTFLTQQLTTAEEAAARAEDAYFDYLSGLPELRPGEDRPAEAEVEQQRLVRALERAEEQVTELETQIAEAELVVAQSRSEAGKTIRVVDLPTVPSAPESNVIKRAITVLTFLILGLVVAGLTLFVITVLDPTIRSAADLAPFVGSNIAVAPVIRRPRARADAGPDDGSGDGARDEFDLDSHQPATV